MDERRTVLIVDDEMNVVYPLEKALTDAGYSTCVAKDGYAALSKAKVLNPDLILLDTTLQGLDGLEVKKRLNLEEATMNIPVIFMKDKVTSTDKVRGFQLKADDFITKPFDFPELMARIDLLSSRRKKYEELFMRDPLTGLSNMHVFKRSLTSLFNVAKRYGRVFSIAVIDIDEFKSINDTFGHHIGDMAIQQMARIMKSVFRETDILIRYGGDEFVVLFPETDERQAKDAIGRLKEKIANTLLPVNPQTKITFAISAGVVQFQSGFKKECAMFELADKRMYEDKQAHKKARPERFEELPIISKKINAKSVRQRKNKISR